MKRFVWAKASERQTALIWFLFRYQWRLLDSYRMSCCKWTGNICEHLFYVCSAALSGVLGGGGGGWHEGAIGFNFMRIFCWLCPYLLLEIKSIEIYFTFLFFFVSCPCLMAWPANEIFLIGSSVFDAVSLITILIWWTYLKIRRLCKKCYLFPLRMMMILRSMSIRCFLCSCKATTCETTW